MKIIADENIPCVEKAFSMLGDVTLLQGRGMTSRQVRDADILLVRSVTRVDRGLLEGSKVRFVGSATIGFDHIDREYLESQGIGFSTAPGSNAISAAEYVISVLMALQAEDGCDLQDKTVGIIGCGNVGSRVRQKLSALGAECLVNDPPLKAQGGHADFVDLEAVLASDIITVHVPLEKEGEHPTFHLVDASFLSRLKPGAVFINTSRGSVVDNVALNRHLASGNDLTVVLDVWEGEPDIDASLLEKVALGTPHIAGYSLDGKVRGTEMIYRAACKYFDHPVEWNAAADLPVTEPVDLDSNKNDAFVETSRAVFCSYDVRQDDERLRKLLSLRPEERPAYFDRLRKEYPVRREFSKTDVVRGAINNQLELMLRGLGFAVEV